MGWAVPFRVCLGSAVAHVFVFTICCRSHLSSEIHVTGGARRTALLDNMRTLLLITPVIHSAFLLGTYFLTGSQLPYDFAHICMSLYLIVGFQLLQIFWLPLFSITSCCT
jgi:hypothetical protein